MPDVRDLGLILDSGVPLVVIETHEEQRVLELVTRLAIARDCKLMSYKIIIYKTGIESQSEILRNRRFPPEMPPL